MDDALRNLVEGSLTDVARELARLSESCTEENRSVLKSLLSFRAGDTYSKHEIPRLISRALVQCGPAGIRALSEALPEAPGSIYPGAIVSTIFYASEGKLFPTFGWAGELPASLDRPLEQPTVQEAKRVIEDLVKDSLVDRDLFDRLISFFYMNGIQGSMGEPQLADRFRTSLFELFTNASIRISQPLINEFSALIAARTREEEYQQFLHQHPVFLDPLARVLIPKCRLGAEHITDFVLQRLDNEYRAVEIEKPQDPIFVNRDKDSDFSAPFFHAVGQVIDFQAWLSKNIAYARELMPGIATPTRGVLVIGTRTGLTSREEHKLYTYVQGHTLIDVFTYDDLLERARHVYSNLVRYRD